MPLQRFEPASQEYRSGPLRLSDVLVACNRELFAFVDCRVQGHENTSAIMELVREQPTKLGLTAVDFRK